MAEDFKRQRNPRGGAEQSQRPADGAPLAVAEPVGEQQSQPGSQGNSRPRDESQLGCGDNALLHGRLLAFALRVVMRTIETVGPSVSNTIGRLPPQTGCQPLFCDWGRISPTTLRFRARVF